MKRTFKIQIGDYSSSNNQTYRYPSVVFEVYTDSISYALDIAKNFCRDTIRCLAQQQEEFSPKPDFSERFYIVISEGNIQHVYSYLTGLKFSVDHYIIDQENEVFTTSDVRYYPVNVNI